MPARFRSFLFAFAMISIASMSFAQLSGVRGVVSDPGGAPLPIGEGGEKGTSQCPGVLTCGSQQLLVPSHSPSGCSDVCRRKGFPLLLEQPLPAYSGVTVWAFHPLRVVTGETSVKVGEYSTPGIS